MLPVIPHWGNHLVHMSRVAEPLHHTVRNQCRLAICMNHQHRTSVVTAKNKRRLHIIGKVIQVLWIVHQRHLSVCFGNAAISRCRRPRQPSFVNMGEPLFSKIIRSSTICYFIMNVGLRQGCYADFCGDSCPAPCHHAALNLLPARPGGNMLPSSSRPGALVIAALLLRSASG